MKRLLQAALVACFALVAGAAFGQGVLIFIDPPRPVPLPRPIPRPEPPPLTYKIKELGLNAKIVDQVAQVQVSQSFVNTGSRQMEVSFVFPLPYDGAVERLTFLVDGKEFDGKLLNAKEARTIYEGYIRKNQDPALLEWVGTGMFKTSVFPVPPGAERKVTLKYSQLLRKNNNLTDFIFPLSTAKYTSQPIEKVSLEATIESQQEIKTVYSPTHGVNVERSDNKHAKVKYEVTNAIPSSDFRLFYDTNDGKLGASVISYRPDDKEDGFYLLLASPEVKTDSMERPAKTVIFAVDRSGSMSGKKFEQAKEALKFVLNNLREGDTFNIVAYDSVVESFKPELQKYDEATRKLALGYVDGLYAGGSTNIDGAMSTALGMVQDANRPTFLLFLTDGLPTAGETNEAKICANAKAKNNYRSRVITFGVGYDLNSRLLDRISRDNHGQSEYVRPDENIEAGVSRLYSKLSSPVMTNVAVKVDIEGAGETAAVNRVYPKEVYDIFAGEQLVQVGRYKKAGSGKVIITGKVAADEKKHDFAAKFIEKSNDQSFAFVEKLWALRRIGEILDEIDLKGKNDELVTELVSLSTKHGIMTPYTSFLADDQAKPGQLADLRGNAVQAGDRLRMLEAADGIAGVAQRAAKNEFKSAAQAPSSGLGGGYGGRPAEAGAKAMAASGPVANSYRDIKTDKEVHLDGIRTAGNQALYRRGKVWVAENAKEVDYDKADAKVQKVARFSDDYFALIKDNTAEENAVLARQEDGETLIVKLRGQTYRIE